MGFLKYNIFGRNSVCCVEEYGDKGIKQKSLQILESTGFFVVCCVFVCLCVCVFVCCVFVCCVLRVYLVVLVFTCVFEKA